MEIDPIAVRAADRLAARINDYFALIPQDYDKRVDIEDFLTLMLMPSAARTLVAHLNPWVKLRYGTTHSLLFYAAEVKLTNRQFREMLAEFYSYAQIARRVAGQLKAVIKTIQEHGWVQGQTGHQEIGFDIIGAVSATCQVVYFHDRLAMLDVMYDEIKSQVGDGVAPTLSDWNDEPTRTKEQVIDFLNRCVARILTI